MLVDGHAGFAQPQCGHGWRRNQPYCQNDLVKLQRLPKRFQAWLGTDLQYRKQSSGGLGDRLTLAFGKAFADGFRRMLALGTDVPGTSTGILAEARERLSHCDVVLDPAEKMWDTISLA